MRYYVISVINFDSTNIYVKFVYILFTIITFINSFILSGIGH